MNSCKQVRGGFTEYLDGRLNGREMQDIAAHLEGCRECAEEWEWMRQSQAALAGLGRAPEPENLLRQICEAVSLERTRSRRSPIAAWSLAWKQTFGPFLLQASAGFASAVLLLGTAIMLVSMFAQPQQAQANTDEPLGNATAPRLLYLADGAGSNQIGAVSGPVVVEAYVNRTGQVYDYRIVSGPTDEATRSQVENLLLWSVFEPAHFFGQPVRGLAVLSFSGVSVRG